MDLDSYLFAHWQDRSDNSVRLSDHLSITGFSESRRKARINAFNKWSEAKTIATQAFLKDDNVEKFFVGSLREGIGLTYNSDGDNLQVNNAVVCLDEGLDSKENTARIVFRLDRKDTPPGYTLLKHTNHGKNNCEYEKKIEFAFVEKNTHLYFSSEKYMTLNEDIDFRSKGYDGKNTVYGKRKGPSIPKYTKSSSIYTLLYRDFKSLNFDSDFVRGFPCQCPVILDKWINRPRHFDWPSQDMIDKVSTLPAHVVPVGQSGSQDEHLQWRICFTLAEVSLVQSFNDTQTKVLVTLRFIAKDLLQSVCSNITSYMMKNVMFWVAESTPTEHFKEQYLLDRLCDALAYLLECVKVGNLPNYMIPERNLLEGKLMPLQAEQLTNKLTSLLPPPIHSNESVRFSVEYILKDHCNEHRADINIAEVLERLELANNMDQIETRMISFMTVDDLARYCTCMYNCKYEIQKKVYHIVYATWPYLCACGWICLLDLLYFVSGEKIRNSNSKYLHQMTGDTNIDNMVHECQRDDGNHTTAPPDVDEEMEQTLDTVEAEFNDTVPSNGTYRSRINVRDHGENVEHKQQRMPMSIDAQCVERDKTPTKPAKTYQTHLMTIHSPTGNARQSVLCKLPVFKNTYPFFNNSWRYHSAESQYITAYALMLCSINVVAGQVFILALILCLLVQYLATGQLDQLRYAAPEHVIIVVYLLLITAELNYLANIWLVFCYIQLPWYDDTDGYIVCSLMLYPVVSFPCIWVAFFLITKYLLIFGTGRCSWMVFFCINKAFSIF